MRKKNFSFFPSGLLMNHHRVVVDTGGSHSTSKYVHFCAGNGEMMEVDLLLSQASVVVHGSGDTDSVNTNF
jgi:hypothetical protein